MTKKKAMDNLYTGIYDEYDAQGKLLNTVLYSINGNYSVTFEMTNPVRQYCSDAEQYFAFTDLFSTILQTLGEGYCIQKQDVFSRQTYEPVYDPDTTAYLSQCYYEYFRGRSFMQIKTYLTVTQETKQGGMFQYDKKQWLDFHNKVQKVDDILKEKGIPHHRLDKQELLELIHRFMAQEFKTGPFTMNNFKCSDENLKMGDRVIKNFPLVDVDEIALPPMAKPFYAKKINGFDVPVDLFSFLTNVPHVDSVVYNQVIMIPKQRKEMSRLTMKSKRHNSMPDPSNKLAKNDIDTVLDVIAKESKLLVYTHFNIMVCMPKDKENSVTSYLETRLYDCGIIASKRAYNQLELFMNSFPGRAYHLNPSYDRFLCLHDAALCFFFKEHIKRSEDTPYFVNFTDRYGTPIAIDITGKEGKVQYTDNSNFFCIGPSGSGKSFSNNVVVRSHIEQGSDVVIVDTGDSYQGICSFYEGRYITYSKETPISMNPFNITKEEYEDGFEEKKNFLLSLIILAWRGTEGSTTSVENMVLNMVVEEYYEHYFNPFSTFSDEERANIKQELWLEAQINGDLDKYSEEMKSEIKESMTKDADDIFYMDSNWSITDEERERIRKMELRAEKLRNVINDKAASEGEKENARKAIIRMTPEIMKSRYLMKLEGRIEAMEEKKRQLKVSSLSFNTFYEYAVRRIPQICKDNNVTFDIREFKFVLKRFYRGGSLEHVLNNEVDKSLFDEQFIVFEIDKIKDDPVLAPIITLIIIDVYLQKMRLKSNRKVLIIEEAWKAIATPVMAGFIQYLYKTVRKFKGVVGVVTQEIGDIIGSAIVKDAIINNSDVKMLLDQSKFKDRYDEIAEVLSLSDIERRKIFTINSMDNHDGRAYFKEVYISRNRESDVYGVEEPPECYMAYTTNRDEKEARLVYSRHYGSMDRGVMMFCRDMRNKNIKNFLEFSRLVNKHRKVMELWEN